MNKPLPPDYDYLQFQIVRMRSSLRILYVLLFAAGIITALCIISLVSLVTLMERGMSDRLNRDQQQLNAIQRNLSNRLVPLEQAQENPTPPKFDRKRLAQEFMEEFERLEKLHARLLKERNELQDQYILLDLQHGQPRVKGLR